MTDAPAWWGPLAAGVSFTVATIGFGAALELLLIEEIRSKVRDKLMRVSQMADNWPTLFLAMFDRLFDPKGKGRPRFWRSAAASMLVLTALLVAWATLLPERADLLIIRLHQTLQVVILIVFFVIPINIVGDFGSLWESRLVIGRMAVTPYTIGKTAFLLLDLIATVGIFVLAFACGLLAYVSAVFGLVYFSVFVFLPEAEWGAVYLDALASITNNFFHFVTSISLLDSLLDSLLFSTSDADLLVIFFYTTLFTSVWVWVFMLGGVLWPLFTWLRGVLRVDRFPVGSAMAIGGVFGGLVVTALGYVRMAVLS